MAPYNGGVSLDGGGFLDYADGDVLDGGGFEWDEQSPIERMRAFVMSFDGGALSRLDIDYTDKVPNAGGLFPNGLVEISRSRDLLGNVTVTNQYNFALYTKLEKWQDAPDNAEWQMAFQEWVQEQSAKGLAPTFGDEPRREAIAAQNGQLYDSDEEGTALYVIQINATFVKNY
jgi:hypothetical protein